MWTTHPPASALVLLSAQLAQAQSTSPSLDELQRKLSVGERIQVFDNNKSRITGRFNGVSGSSLRLIVKGTGREIPETLLYEVRRERREGDGVLIGMGIGAVAGLTYVSLECRDASEHDDCINSGNLVIVAPAIAVGAFVDWGIRRFETIFQRTTGSADRLRVSPVLNRHQKGLVVGIVF